jgi:hypothetical protein
MYLVQPRVSQLLVTYERFSPPLFSTALCGLRLGFMCSLMPIYVDVAKLCGSILGLLHPQQRVDDRTENKY